jgi:hypothetical protein
MSRWSRLCLGAYYELVEGIGLGGVQRPEVEVVEDE